MNCLIRTFFLTFIFLLFVSVSPAYAYLDPGTGSLVLQTLLVIVVGSMFFLKNIWRKIKSFFTGKKKESDEEK